MTTVYIADTGVFVRCGGPDKDKFQRLRRSLRQAGVSLRIPQRVYEELGGDPAADVYRSGNIPHPDGFEEGWVVVADELDYTNPLVSTVMDEARRFIADETDRDEDVTEKADTALVGLAVQVLDTGKADRVVLFTTDNRREERPRRSYHSTASTAVSNFGMSVSSISKRSQLTNFGDLL